MRLSQIIQRFRDIVADDAKKSWDDYEATRFANLACLRAYEEQRKRDDSYHNHEFDISGTDAVQVQSNAWQYTLPRWVDRFHGVQEASGSTESPKPYLRRSVGLEDGVVYDQSNRVIVRGFSSAPDLTFSVCKAPARMHIGTCASDASGSTSMYSMTLPTEGRLTYEFDHEVDAYVNAIVEITSGADGSRDPVGQIRRITASSREASGTDYRFLWTIDKAWTTDPDEGDGYEFHPEIGESNVEFLVLKMARMAFQSQGNAVQLQAIERDYMNAYDAFINSITPRDDGNPTFWLPHPDALSGSDPDRDHLRGIYNIYA